MLKVVKTTTKLSTKSSTFAPVFTKSPSASAKIGGSDNSIDHAWAISPSANSIDHAWAIKKKPYKHTAKQIVELSKKKANKKKEPKKN